MQRFIKDLKKYTKYAVFQAKSDLKSEVANSYLNWMWWILDPLFFMLIYAFVSIVVFKTTEQYFPIFVFLGLTVWEFFNRMVLQSVKIISSNKSIITKVYIPKYILVISRTLVNSFKMLVSFFISVIMMFFYRIELNIQMLLIVIIFINIIFITFGISVIVAHFGVFVQDLQHVFEIILKFVFYFTGIFYGIESRIPKPYSYFMIRLNPVAFHIDALRKILLYNEMFDWEILLFWVVVGFICAIVGIKKIYQYENTYVKVI